MASWRGLDLGRLPPVRTVVAGAVVEYVAFAVLVAAGGADVPSAYAVGSPLRAAPLLGGAVAGYWGVRTTEDGPATTRPALAGGVCGGLLATAVTGVALVGLGLATVGWPVAVLAGAAVVLLQRRRRGSWRDHLGLAALLVVSAVLAVATRLRLFVGSVSYLLATLPRIGAFAFLPVVGHPRGVALYALAVGANVLGGVLGGALAGRIGAPREHSEQA